jgi:hypothetical protein
MWLHHSLRLCLTNRWKMMFRNPNQMQPVNSDLALVRLNMIEWVEVSRQGKPLEGISTLDLITLSRHISGQEIITEPYKLYAADLDGNGHVGANDLLLLKKALLGGYKIPSYPGNLSWVFFGDPCAPNAPEDLFNAYCHSGVEVDHTGAFPATVFFQSSQDGRRECR